MFDLKVCKQCAGLSVLKLAPSIGSIPRQLLLNINKMTNNWIIDSLVLILFITKSILPVLGLLLLLSALDDLFVDVAYAVRRVWRRYFIYRRHTRLNARTISTLQLVNTAIMIPAWQEANVIGQMLKSTTTLWPDPEIHFFIGVYKNDPETVAIVQHWAQRDRRIRMCFVPYPGPTTKADCLNTIWQEILYQEKFHQLSYQAFVLHDCEDLVSAREPYVISHLIHKLDVLQFPVRPMQLPGSVWISGHYLDEFAESHGKDLIVREWLGAALPSAGVGCAFSRRALEYSAHTRYNRPFAAHSLTEDYELAIRLGQAGFQQAFISIPAAPNQAALATSEYFPGTFRAAVKQKSRWLLGITLQGWDQLQWSGSFADRYMFLRDRKALITAFLNALALLILLILIGIALWQRLDSHAAHFAPLVIADSPLEKLYLINGYFCCHRILIRSAFVTRYYGLGQGLLSIPRTIVANAINLSAALRALWLYSKGRATAMPVAWEKTTHVFPQKISP
jgi:bacteriophage N4 adsorption protein B